MGLSGSDDHCVKLWDVRSGDCVMTYRGHKDAVNCIAVSTDGHVAISGSSDKTMRMWNLATGECLLTCTGHSDIIFSVAMSWSGKIAISGGMDKTVNVWDLNGGNCLHTFSKHKGIVFGVALSTDGTRAITGGGDGFIFLWRVSTMQCLMSFKSPPICSVALSKDERLAVSGGADGSLSVWNLKNGKKMSSLRAHSDWVLSVAFTHDARWILSASKDKTLKLWDCDYPNKMVMSIPHFDWFFSCDIISSNGLNTLAGGSYGTIKVWMMNTGDTAADCCRVISGHYGYVNCVSIVHKSQPASPIEDLEHGLTIKDLEHVSANEDLDIPFAIHDNKADADLTLFEASATLKASKELSCNLAPNENGAISILPDNLVDLSSYISADCSSTRSFMVEGDEVLEELRKQRILMENILEKVTESNHSIAEIQKQLYRIERRVSDLESTNHSSPPSPHSSEDGIGLLFNTSSFVSEQNEGEWSASSVGNDTESIHSKTNDENIPWSQQDALWMETEQEEQHR